VYKQTHQLMYSRTKCPEGLFSVESVLIVWTASYMPTYPPIRTSSELYSNDKTVPTGTSNTYNKRY